MKNQFFALMRLMRSSYAIPASAEGSADKDAHFIYSPSLFTKETARIGDAIATETRTSFVYKRFDGLSSEPPCLDVKQSTRKIMFLGRRGNGILLGYRNRSSTGEYRDFDTLVDLDKATIVDIQGAEIEIIEVGETFVRYRILRHLPKLELG